MYTFVIKSDMNHLEQNNQIWTASACNVILAFDLFFFFSYQFALPRAEKELYEKEERAEVQQEILKKVARNLPVYTRTAGGGEVFYCKVTGRLSI